MSTFDRLQASDHAERGLGYSHTVRDACWMAGRAALAASRLVRRLPGGRAPVDALRLWRLQRLSSVPHRTLSRYELDQLVLLTLGYRVARGPFAGLRYVEQAHGSVLAAKVLGTYEQELHGWMEKIVSTAYRRILVVGCGEGYYAVGLAARMPGVEVLAFDLDPAARAATRALAARNGVSGRVAIRQTCDHETLQSLITDMTLVLCDIEGEELDLLEPAQAPALRQCDLLVEVHDVPPSTYCHDQISQRFRESHVREKRVFAERSLERFPWPETLRDERLRRRALEEGRTRGLSWLFFKRAL